MLKLLHVIRSSLRAVFTEVWKNRLRSFLSLFGVTIGVFCIISVLATVNSLERNIRAEMKSFGANTIYVDKWEYSASGPGFAYWKYALRPAPKYEELPLVRERTPSARFVAFKINRMGEVEYRGAVARVRLYGLSEDFGKIQPLPVSHGTYLSPADFMSGSNAVLIGYEVAEKIFGQVERATGKFISIQGKTNRVAGVLKKQGRQLLGGWGFDESIVMPYQYARTIMDERRADPLILVQAKENANTAILKEDLTGAMRSIHKLKPRQENDFSLNDINDFSTILSATFRNINLAGWAIGGLAFVVGIFGVANIMFVSVKERTQQIGIKKALGAKNRFILLEFLLESAFLCIMGGLFGLVLVFILTRIVSSYFDFPVFLSLPVMLVAFLISLAAGVLAGILPARQAAKMNPISAIRS